METIQPKTHVDDESIELYVLGRVTQTDASVISEHLFECDQCFSSYERTAAFISAMRTAAPRLQNEPEKAPWWQFAAWPKQAFAVGAMAALALVLFVPKFNQPGSPIATDLTAVRSGSTAHYPAGHILNLRLDTTGVDTPSPVKVQMVNDGGQTKWDGQAILKDGKWETSVDTKLSSGHYWVRVFNPQTKEQIREYPVVLE